jgi:hypothetical protein
MTTTTNKIAMDYWIAVGKYYGYPSCCITSFCESAAITNTQNAVHQHTGFIPCDECATKIYVGETTLNALITDRKCLTPFPTDDDD